VAKMENAFNIQDRTNKWYTLLFVSRSEATMHTLCFIIITSFSNVFAQLDFMVLFVYQKNLDGLMLVIGAGLGNNP
jgi:hypothetical protein